MTGPDRHVIEVYRDEHGTFRWRRKAGNGEIVADSGEGYTSARYAADYAATLHPGVDVLDLTDTDETPSSDDV